MEIKKTSLFKKIILILALILIFMPLVGRVCYIGIDSWAGIGLLFIGGILGIVGILLYIALFYLGKIRDFELKFYKNTFYVVLFYSIGSYLYLLSLLGGFNGGRLYYWIFGLILCAIIYYDMYKKLFI